MSPKEYIIRGGVEGRERLRILSRVLQKTTLQLFHEAGVKAGMHCLDLGCGGGDVSVDLAGIVGPAGKVVGVDIDHSKIEIARNEAIQQNLANVEFIAEDIYKAQTGDSYDVAYARFLLTHLKVPSSMLELMYSKLKHGGVVIIEDIDFRGHFTFPENDAYNRYVQLYTEASIKADGHPHIGSQLPILLKEAGFEKIGMNIIQPAGTKGEVKYLAAITMENIADTVVRLGLADREEIDTIIPELYRIAEDENVVVSMPRIVQAWGYRT